MITKIEYVFSDSSVPPRFHRSYRIDLDPNEVQIVIDSYGTVLVDTIMPVEKGAFKAILEKASALEASGEKITKGNPTGTSSQTIILKEEEKEAYSLYWDSLQDVSQGTEDFVKAIKATIPNFTELLQTSLK